MKKSFIATAFLLCCMTLSADPELKIKADGTLEAAGLTVRFLTVTKKWAWRDNRKWTEIKRSVKKDETSFSAEFFLGGSSFSVTEKITRSANGRFSVGFTQKSEPFLELARCGAYISFDPAETELRIDGKLFSAGTPDPKTPILYFGKPKQVSIHGLGVDELILFPEGYRVSVFEGRLKKGRNIDIAILAPLEDESVKMKFSGLVRKMSAQPVDLSSFVNRPLADTPEKPGWTGQGAGHDMSAFPGRSAEYHRIPFRPVPGMALAVGGRKREGAVKEYTLPLPENNAGAVHLLHTSAWTPDSDFGEIRACYADGTGETIRLAGRRDCNDWLSKTSGDNAVPAWSEVGNDGSPRTVFFSSFGFKRKGPVRLVFRACTDQIFWFICGITLGDGKILHSLTHPVIRIGKAGPEWAELEFRNVTEPGSVLDFSENLDAPAGKYGRAMPAPGGKFLFANGRPLRIFGIDLCLTMLFPSNRAEAEKIARQLAATGYNAVRLMYGGLLIKHSPDGQARFVQDRIEKFDELVSVLREHGFYYTFDLFCASAPGVEMQPPFYTMDAERRKEWKRAAALLLKHRNPHTGLTYGEDPALLFSNLMNEDNIDTWWNCSKEARELSLKRFGEWKRKHGLGNDVPADPGNPEFLHFLLESQKEAHADMKAFVRKEVHSVLPVTSLNFYRDAFLIPMRDHFDVVDTHYYHAHPAFAGKPWQSTQIYDMRSSVLDLAGLARCIFLSRRPDKPFFVTEYSCCNPNPYRAECGSMMGAYAALQDWTGLFRFCYSHNRKRVENLFPAVFAFESVADPIMQLSDRITSSLFLRGDARSASRMYVYPYRRDGVRKGDPRHIPEQVNKLGLIAGVGTCIQEDPPSVPVTILSGTTPGSITGPDARAWAEVLEKERARSSTGEILLDVPRKEFSVVTPRTESLLLWGGSLKGKILEVHNAKGFQNIALISRDGKPLSESGRMLLLQLSDTTNTGSVIRLEKDRAFALRPGKLPLLIRKVSSEIRLRLPENAEIHALSADGVRKGKVNTRSADGFLCFTAKTDLFPGGVPAYEILCPGKKN